MRQVTVNESGRLLAWEGEYHSLAHGERVHDQDGRVLVLTAYAADELGEGDGASAVFFADPPAAP